MENEKPSKSDAALREERILKFWQDNKIFEKTLTKESPEGEFVFFEGPPTANAKPALHHLEARAFKDVIPRYKTMQGFHVRRQGGWDTHGLPVELQIEKKLGLNSKKAIEDYGIGKFNKECKDSVFEYIKDWEDFTDRIGYWVDKKNAYFTFNNSYIESLWSVLAHVEKRGLLYKDYRIVPWCSRCGTPLASHELAQGYEDIKDLSIFAKFPIKGFDKAYFVAWTTTPWTLPGNVALAVGADIDYVEAKVGEEILVVAKERLAVIAEPYEIIAEHKGSEMAGMEYEPLYDFVKPNDKSHKVYVADFVTTVDGTGIVHIAPMYGQDDFELGTKAGLPKEHVVGLDGKFLPNTGFFSGRFAMEKDENGKPTLAVDVINDLTARGLFYAKKNYEHTYPHCWRCKTPLVYYARDSWYIRMSELRDEMVEENKSINWEPSHIRDGRFGEWLKDIKDWAISRERYWGTPLPVWMSEDGERLVVDSVETLRAYSKQPITKIIFVRHGEAEHNVMRMSSSAHDKHPLTVLGRKQAAEAAEKLSDEKPDIIFSSPILRSRQTASAYAGSADIVIDDRLGEIQSGNWEEQTQDDPAIKASRDAYKALPTDERFLVKRGDTGESWADLEARVKNFLDEVLAKYAGKTIVCFAHQGTNEIAFKLLRGLDNHEAMKLFHQIDNGTILKAYVDNSTSRELDLHRPFIDDIVLEKEGKEFRRVKEVMDVWFDSGAMPFAQHHYPFENKKYIDGGFLSKGKGYPADFISEAVDQTRGWFYTLHAVGALMGKGKAYKNCICLGHILDAKGKKMSKSIGNIVNPWEMMDKYGVDTLRLWMYSVNQPGDSKNFDEKTVAELRNKVFNLLYNVLAFYELYRDKALEAEYSESKNVLDVWILERLNELTNSMTESLNSYKLLEPVRALRDFIDDLSTWYLRRSRDRLKDGDTDAKATLYHVLKTVARLLAPFAPFAAEDIWQTLRNERDEESVHLAEWPENKKTDSDVLDKMGDLRTIANFGLRFRQENKVPIRQPLNSATVTGIKFDPIYIDILKEELNVKDIKLATAIGNVGIMIDATITPELKREGDFREFLRGVQGMRKDQNLLPSEMVSLTIPENQKDVITGFEDELKKTAGIKEISFGGEEVRIEK